ncbi:homing endonuclease [Escherichia phage EC128]|nr:homing endonuclease [Escherichia phage EC128]
MKWKLRKSLKIDNSVAFTYMVRFPDKSFYIGFKKFKTIYGKDTNWKEYNSSSKLVKEKLKDYKAKWIILQVFDSYESALKHEEMLIRKHFNNEFILNKSIGGYKFNKYPDSEEHKQKLSNAHKGKILSLKHKDKIREKLIEHYKNNSRSEAHVKNNIGSRTAKKTVSIALKSGNKFRSFKSAAKFLKCSEEQVSNHPNVIDIKITIHPVPEYVRINDNIYKSFVDAAKDLKLHPSRIKDLCLDDNYPNYIVSYKRVEK